MSALPPKPTPAWVYVAIVFVYTIAMVALSFYSQYHGCG